MSEDYKFKLGLALAREQELIKRLESAERLVDCIIKHARGHDAIATGYLLDIKDAINGAAKNAG